MAQNKIDPRLEAIAKRKSELVILSKGYKKVEEEAQAELVKEWDALEKEAREILAKEEEEAKRGSEDKSAKPKTENAS